MRVGIERDADIGVTEALADDLGVNTLPEQASRMRVPQIMESKMGQLGTSDERRKGG